MLTDPWRGRRLVLLALFVALVPLPARADGISGGLAAMQAFALIILGLFAIAWIAIWWALRALKRRRATRGEPTARPPSDAPAPRHWLFDASIPVGLRILALVQFLLAPLYALDALMCLIFPSRHSNGRIHPELVQSILFGALFCVLALVAAGAYLNRRDRTAFRLGVALGWLCVGNAVLFIWLNTRHSIDFDHLSPRFGVVLLVLLYTRYRRYFQGGDAEPPVRSAAAAQ